MGCWPWVLLVSPTYWNLQISSGMFRFRILLWVVGIGRGSIYSPHPKTVSKQMRTTPHMLIQELSLFTFGKVYGGFHQQAFVYHFNITLLHDFMCCKCIPEIPSVQTLMTLAWGIFDCSSNETHPQPGQRAWLHGWHMHGFVGGAPYLWNKWKGIHECVSKQ